MNRAADGSRTRAVVEEYLNRRGRGDPDEVAQVFAPTVDWRVSWPVESHPVVPWIRPCATRADVARLCRTFAECCDPAAGHVTVDDVLVTGFDAVVFGTSSQLVVSTGKRFVMTFALRLTVEDGLISRHHMYEDSIAVEAAFVVGS